MATIALFHSVLGVRAGIEDAADRFRSAGHDVRVVDQYDGRSFDDYDEASAFVDSLGGFPILMQRALDGVSDLADGFVAMGFSNGSGMATWVALHRPVRAVVLCSGALPLERIGAGSWPDAVPAQLHYAIDDPRKVDGSVESVMRSINTSGAVAEYQQYPGSGHLFTDPLLPDEFEPGAAEAFWLNVVRYLRELPE